MAPINYGIWGKPTATLDWCEDNYVVTQFIAEFWNTISNWIMIIPPLLAAHLSWKKLMEFRIVAAYLSLGLVGIGSFGFHCTLIYKMQLLDELPMIYGTCILLYGMIEVRSKENKMNKQLIFFFLVVSALISVMYVGVLNPLFFQWAYGILAGSLFGLTLYNCKKYDGSFPLVMVSIVSYGFGFILWNIDNNFCPQIRTARALLPGFARPVTQLHAWWHTFAGSGTYLSVLFGSHLRLKCLGYNPVLKIYYKFLPIVEREDANPSKHFLNTYTTNNNINNSKASYAGTDHIGSSNGKLIRIN